MNWKQGILSEVVEFLGRGKSPVYEPRSSFPVLNQACIQNGRLDLDKLKFVSRAHFESLDETRKTQRGDILVNSTGTGTLGRIGLWDGNDTIAFDGHVTVIRLKSDFEPRFFYHWLHTPDAQLQIQNDCLSGSTNQVELSRVPFQRLRVYYPSSKQEQVKIAEVLSAVDQAIEQTEALIAKYRRVKMGLMQDLFTRGIDEHGDLRDPTIHQFKLSPLGQVPEEWDVVTVESVGSVNLGRQRSPTHHNGPFMTPYLRVANVFDGWIDYTDVLEMNFTPTERKVYSLVPGDILLNEGQSLELVGRSAIFDGPKNTYCFQNTLVRFRCYERNEPAFCQAVFKYWLDTSRFQLAAKQTTSIAHLGADRFAKMPFARPKQDEQKRIAVVLEAQERSLSLQSSQLANLKRLKTGLMQDLLTGKVSVEPLLAEEAITR